MVRRGVHACRGLKGSAGRTGCASAAALINPNPEKELIMSQSTDTTQPLPMADPDATVQMPIVQPVAPAVPVVPPMPAFDAVRVRLIHTHRVLGRLLGTAALPTPDKASVNAYGDGIELLMSNADGLPPFAELFGGTPETEEKDSPYAPSGRISYSQLLTVVDGVYVRVWSLTDLPAVEAAEPEPQHDPAPAPAPETPVEHPEAA